jgi:hypothetical protein
MKKFILFYAVLFFFLNSFFSSAQTTISNEDFKPLIGGWSGTLTYLDYTSNKPYTMPAELSVVQVGETNNYIFNVSFPDEPRANSADTVSISGNGSELDGETVISKRLINDKTLEVVTEIMSVDGNENKAAAIRHTYSIGAEVFVIKKTVQFAGEKDWINRNEFNFKKTLVKK